MRLLALALLVSLPQQAPSDAHTTRRSLTLVSGSDEPLREGSQIPVYPPYDKDAPKNLAMEIYHRGKLVPSWLDDNSVTWFRIQKDIPPRGRDSEYEVRYGGKVALRAKEVFDFFEDFAAPDLDPAKWEWDRGVTFTKDGRGLAVTALPGGLSEHAPVSFIPRLGTIPKGFVFEAILSWKIPEDSAFSFGVKVELETKAAVTEEDKSRAAKAIGELDAEEIEVREGASKVLVKLGAAALPQLVEAAKSKEAEVRARAVAVINAIYRENPPPAIATGYTSPGAAEKTLDLMMQIGKSRAVLKSASASEVAMQRVTIWRDPDGEATIGWDDRKPRLFPVPGKAARIRFDFWAPSAGPIGEMRISRVILRRYVDTMPVKEFGKPEPLK